MQRVLKHSQLWFVCYWQRRVSCKRIMDLLKYAGNPFFLKILLICFSQIFKNLFSLWGSAEHTWKQKIMWRGLSQCLCHINWFLPNPLGTSMRITLASEFLTYSDAYPENIIFALNSKRENYLWLVIKAVLLNKLINNSPTSSFGPVSDLFWNSRLVIFSSLVYHVPCVSCLC